MLRCYIFVGTGGAKRGFKVLKKGFKVIIPRKGEKPRTRRIFIGPHKKTTQGFDP